MHRVTSYFNGFSTTANVAFAVAAMACLLFTRPGFANEGAGNNVQVATAGPAMASVDLDALAHRTSTSSVQTERAARSRDSEEDRQHVAGSRDSTTSSASTIVEPATIAVLGFTAAALIAIRRKKNQADVQRIS